MYDALFSIVIFGDDGCGKTSLVKKFMTNIFISDSPRTIGVDFEIKSFNLGNRKIKLQIWDFGSAKRSFLLSSYIVSARGGLFMYDITNYFSLAHLDDWIGIVRKEKRADVWFPIIMVGGKADLGNEREVSTQEGREIAKSRGVDGFIECSSKSGENVENVFKTLTRLMMLKTFK